MSSIRCPECNLTNWATAIACKRCGYFFQPPENGSPDEPVNPAGAFEEYQPQSIADSQPTNQFQQQWSNHQSYSPPRLTNQMNYRPPKQKIGLAVASLVLGLLGCFFAPVGLILGIVALVKIKRYPYEYGGQGMAIAGVVLSGLTVLMFPLIAAIAIPNLLASRRSANEGAAISSIRKIAAAENSYMASIGTTNCADLAQLGKFNMIDPVLAGGTKSGYRFVISALPDGCEIYATPTVAKGVSATGIRSFFSSSEEGWQIRAGKKNGLTADKYDLPIDGGDFPTTNNSRPKIASSTK